MFKAKIISFCLLFLIQYQLVGQCECENCPLDIEWDIPVEATIQVSGAVNDILDISGQRVCKVLLDFEHEAISEVTMELIAPDGSSVDLMIEQSSDFGPLDFWDICFVPCDSDADPDSGFSEIFDNEEDWQGNGPFTGSYYPNNGCLEQDLSGSINGTWTLSILDGIFLDDGILNNFEIIFADAEGIDCQDDDGCEFVESCLAEGGGLPESALLYCEGAPELDVDLTPTFTGGESEAPDDDYNYIYVVTEGPEITGYVTSTDFSVYPPGIYVVCGLSILEEDEDLLPDINAGFDNEDIQDLIDDGTICADLSTNCTTFFINPDIDIVFTGPTNVCAGELVQYTIENFDEDLSYLYSILAGSFQLFIIDEETGIIDVIWTSGPGELCVSIPSSPCDIEQVCLNITIEDSDVMINGNVDVCPNSMETYILEPGLNPGESYDVSIDNGTLISLDDNELIIEWEEDGDGEVCVSILGGDCEETETCLSITILEEPDFPEFGFLEQVCLGNTTLFFASPTDPAILEYNWSVVNATINSTNNESVEVFHEFLGEWQLCLEIVTECGVLDEVCQTGEVFELPEPTIDPVLEFCNTEFTLEAIPSDPNNVFLWICQACGGDVTFSDQTNYITDVSVPGPGTYPFVLQEFGTYCSGSIEVDVIITDGLDVEELEFECDIDGNYEISFEITSGSEPYTINGDLISGNEFTSTLLANGDPYSFEIIDSEGCTDLIEGSFDCPCTTEAGNMSDDLITLCISSSESAVSEFDDDAVFDSNDIGYFVLHDEDDDDLGDIISFNDTGIFEFDPDVMEAGEIYYISFVVGNDLGGLIDYDDECTDVSLGQPVVFYDDPDVFAGEDIFICGLEVILGDDANLSGIWQLLNGPDGAEVDIDIDGDLAEVEVDQYGDYEFQLEAEENGCFDTDVLSVVFQESPQIVDVNTICNNGIYQVSFVISGGLGPFEVNGDPLVGNTFISEEFESGDEYEFDVVDDNGCLSNEIEGIVNCDCDTDAGTMSGDPITVCPVEGELFTGSYNNDGLIGPGQIGLYVLHNSPSNILGDILAISEDGSFEYNPSYGEDVIYYISFVVSNDLNGNIDEDDPCLAVSIGQPVEILELVVVSSGPDVFACNNEVTIIPDDQGEEGFWEIISTPDNALIILESIEGESVNLILDSIGTYELSWIPDSGCYLTDTMQIVFANDLEMNVEEVLCSDDFLSYDLNLEISGGSGTFIYQQDTLTSDLFFEDLVTDSLYEFIVADLNGCQDTLEFIQNCSCDFTPASFEEDSINICNTQTSLSISFSDAGTFTDFFDGYYVIHDGSVDVLGNIIMTSESGLFDQLDLLDPGSELYISFVFDQIEDGIVNLSDPCLAFSQSILINIQIPPSVDAGDDQIVCGQEVQLNASSSSLNTEWTYLDGTITNYTIDDEAILTPMIEVDEFGSLSLQVTADDGVCTSTDSVQLIFIEEPEAVQINLPEVLCIENPDYNPLNLEDIIITGDASGSWFIDNMEIGQSISLSDYEPGSYTLTYITENPNCGQSTSELEIELVECPCPQLISNEASVCQNELNFLLGDYLNIPVLGQWVLLNGPQSSDILINSDGLVDLNMALEGAYEIEFIPQNDNDYCQEDLILTLFVEEGFSAGQYIDPGQLCLMEGEMIDLSDYLSSNASGAFYNANLELIDQDVTYSTNNSNQFYFIVENSICSNDTLEINLDIQTIPLIEYDLQDNFCIDASDGQISLILSDINTVSSITLNGNAIEPSILIDELTSGFYELEVSFINGCQETIDFQINDEFSYSIDLGDDIVVNESSNVPIQIQTDLELNDIVNIVWFEEGQVLPFETLDVIITVDQSTTISVQLTDINGCEYEDQIRISLEQIFVEPEFANIIDLNSSVNALFEIPESLLADNIIEFAIYDRWGSMMYSVENISSDFEQIRWDGRHQGQAVGSGVYVFYLRFEYGGTVFQRSGDITVIK